MIQIRIANLSDKNEIKFFINKYWKKNHILALSDDFLDYMYKNELKKTYNFVLAIDQKMKSINGILGFIPISKYDKDISSKKDLIWFSIWKVLDFPGNKLLGIRLMRFLFKLFPDSNFGTVGANKLTLPIYRSLGFKTEILHTFISANKKIKDYKIARLDNLKINSKNNDIIDSKIENITFNIDEFKDIINKIAIISNSYKNYEFLKNRYFKNSFLNYEVWLLKYKINNSVLVARRINYLDTSLLKIVDFIGLKNNLISLKGKLQSKIINDSEYIEFRSFGLEDQLKEAGFVDLTEDQNIIIPAYHDPFVFTNKTINWTLKNFKEDDYLVTGDCDQDRPNSIIVKSNV